jgi:hypothetical protein
VQLTSTTKVTIHSTYRLAACLGEPSKISITWVWLIELMALEIDRG